MADRFTSPLALQCLPFDQVPEAHRTRIFGVDYVHIVEDDGGELYVTRYGWPRLEYLLPEKWYAGSQYSLRGQKLPGGTGNVYRVSTHRPGCQDLHLVVKFSRFAQEVPLFVGGEFPDNIAASEVANARFNGPFEEFGLLHEMRNSIYGPPELRIRTKLPLAIYEPAQTYSLWQLGRTQGRFSYYRRMMEQHLAEGTSPEAVQLDINRDYILLFQWMDGMNAEELYDEGTLAAEEFEAITPRVIEEMKRKGFRILDNKPRHIILRKRRRDGQLLRREGKLVYGMVDFELLVRTPEYQQFLSEQPEPFRRALGL